MPRGASYKQALRLNSELPLATLGLAKIDAAQNRVEHAIATLIDLTQQYPLPAAVVLLGDLQEESGDPTGLTNLLHSLTPLQRCNATRARWLIWRWLSST